LEKSSGSKSGLSVQVVVLAGVFWAVAALLFFLLFSVTVPGQEHPKWYSIGTSVFEAIAYLAATLLCFRNWRSPQIVSGRNVWLFIGLGMLCYFIGNLLFSLWEIGFGLEPDVSIGDFFFVLTYIFLIAGMSLAVASRRLNLEIWQWGVVAVIAAVGILLAWLTAQPPATANADALWLQPAMAQTAPKATPKAAPASPVKPPEKPAVSPVPGPPAESTAIDAPSSTSTAPDWAIAVGEALEPLKPILNWYYVISDILLLIIATTLLLAFWGGRFAQSWRMIAAAAFSLYIADIWFKYATNSDPNYQSGSLPEVFWVFSGVLFGIGAALEYDLSSRSRSRSGGRRRSTA
jgi:hypothetical protein